ncbi:MAG TPA: SET domain-containing protein [Pyrinomonadaceae bacterium]|jgi:hypothetical protein
MSPSSAEGFRALQTDSGKGRGLFATRRYGVGEAIYRLDYWSREEMPMHLTNHSCDPNASFDGGGMLVAVREIEAGEEITFDYTAHPLPASPWNFKCCCGAEACVGWVDVGGGRGDGDVSPRGDGGGAA